MKKLLIFLIILLIVSIITLYLIKEEEFIPNGDIPKILHLIWIGDKQLPDGVYSWTERFRKSNPDWTVTLWRDKDIDDLGLVNRKQYDEMEEYCGKADIARYEIIYRYGGMYIDADTMWLENPIHPKFFKGSINFFKEDNGLIANGWINAVKNHPFLKLVIDEIPKREKRAAWLSVGPTLLTDLYRLIKNKKQYNINLLPVEYVLCPSNWKGITNNEKYNTILENCKNNKKAFAFHYGSSTNNIF